jgi:hypothetical protein
VKICDFQQLTSGDRCRVTAEVQWEDCGRPQQQVYYETASPFAADLTCSPNGFLVAAFIPAMRSGERRVAVEGPICPELRDGLQVAMRWLHQWHGDARRPITIEAELEPSPQHRPRQDRAACFFTGGVDSMATLRHNRLGFPPTHPCSIRDGIIIYGLEVDREAAFDDVLASLSVVADDAGMTLLPVFTNVRSLELDWTFWEFEWEGAVYASVAHALSKRLTIASVSSTYDIPHMTVLGSHPLLDPNYSSASLRVRHEGVTMSRLDKLRLIADWPVGLDRLRVCNVVEKYRQETINCGRCEKCIRTMLGLAAIGVLHKTKAFSGRDLTPDAVVTNAQIHSPHLETFYRELVEPLATQARHDLAHAVQHVLSKHGGELGWKGSLRRLDREHLGGRLRLMKRLFVEESKPH